MQLTHEQSTNYVPDAPADLRSEEAPDQEAAWWRKLPTLFWASVTLFAVNAIIGASLLLTPTMAVDAFGEELAAADYYSESRPSPYARTVDTAKRRVRQPEQLYPTAFIAPEPSYAEASYANWESASGPTSYRRVHTAAEPLPSSRNIHKLVYRQTDSNVESGSANDYTTLDLPRMTAAMPRASMKVLTNSQEISPQYAASGSDAEVNE